MLFQPFRTSCEEYMKAKKAMKLLGIDVPEKM
jgi:hypothetical protein